LVPLPKLDVRRPALWPPSTWRISPVTNARIRPRFTRVAEANSSSVCDININVTPLDSPRR